MEVSSCTRQRCQKRKNRVLAEVGGWGGEGTSLLAWFDGLSCLLAWAWDGEGMGWGGVGGAGGGCWPGLVWPVVPAVVAVVAAVAVVVARLLLLLLLLFVVRFLWFCLLLSLLLA